MRTFQSRFVHQPSRPLFRRKYDHEDKIPSARSLVAWENSEGFNFANSAFNSTKYGDSVAFSIANFSKLCSSLLNDQWRTACFKSSPLFKKLRPTFRSQVIFHRYSNLTLHNLRKNKFKFYLIKYTSALNVIFFTVYINNVLIYYIYIMIGRARSLFLKISSALLITLRLLHRRAFDKINWLYVFILVNKF